MHDHVLGVLGVNTASKCPWCACVAGVTQRILRSPGAGAATTSSAPGHGAYPCFHAIPESQPVLPCLLRRLLQKGKVDAAIALAAHHSRWSLIADYHRLQQADLPHAYHIDRLLSVVLCTAALRMTSPHRCLQCAPLQSVVGVAAFHSTGGERGWPSPGPSPAAPVQQVYIARRPICSAPLANQPSKTALWDRVTSIQCCPAGRSRQHDAATAASGRRSAHRHGRLGCHSCAARHSHPLRRLRRSSRPWPAPCWWRPRSSSETSARQERSDAPDSPHRDAQRAAPFIVL
jgi:hypothetical protein